MEIISSLIDFILHIDVHLTEITTTYGTLTYAILFGIVFAETGFVVTPFLPGDSLLFATGAIAAIGGLNIGVAISILFIAAIVGDAVNYWIGHFFGQRIIQSPRLPMVKDEYITKAEEFYIKHGGKAIILSRFVPIVRTFAPFVAGVGRMNYGKFTFYNVVGGAAWVLLFSLAGFFFGNIPEVKHNFSLVIMGIIAVSVVPIFYEAYKNRRESSKNKN
jgi:membrane-associated protein